MRKNVEIKRLDVEIYSFQHPINKKATVTKTVAINLYSLQLRLWKIQQNIR